MGSNRTGDFSSLFFSDPNPWNQSSIGEARTAQNLNKNTQNPQTWGECRAAIWERVTSPAHLLQPQLIGLAGDAFGLVGYLVAPKLWWAPVLCDELGSAAITSNFRPDQNIALEFAEGLASRALVRGSMMVATRALPMILPAAAVPIASLGVMILSMTAVGVAMTYADDWLCGREIQDMTIQGLVLRAFDTTTTLGIGKARNSVCGGAFNIDQRGREYVDTHRPQLANHASRLGISSLIGFAPTVAMAGTIDGGAGSHLVQGAATVLGMWGLVRSLAHDGPPSPHLAEIIRITGEIGHDLIENDPIPPEAQGHRYLGTDLQILPSLDRGGPNREYYTHTYVSESAPAPFDLEHAKTVLVPYLFDNLIFKGGLGGVNRTEANYLGLLAGRIAETDPTFVDKHIVARLHEMKDEHGASILEDIDYWVWGTMGKPAVPTLIADARKPSSYLFRTIAALGVSGASIARTEPRYVQETILPAIRENCKYKDAHFYIDALGAIAQVMARTDPEYTKRVLVPELKEIAAIPNSHPGDPRYVPNYVNGQLRVAESLRRVGRTLSESHADFVSTEIVPEFVKFLNSPVDQKICESGRKALKSLGVSAIDPLVELLGTNTVYVAEVLQSIGHPAIPALVEALRCEGKKGDVAQSILISLDHDTKTISALMDDSLKLHPRQYARSLTCLGHIANFHLSQKTATEVVLPRILEGVESPDSLVVNGAVQALSAIDSQSRFRIPKADLEKVTALGKKLIAQDPQFVKDTILPSLLEAVTWRLGGTAKPASVLLNCFFDTMPADVLGQLTRHIDRESAIDLLKKFLPKASLDNQVLALVGVVENYKNAHPSFIELFYNFEALSGTQKTKVLQTAVDQIGKIDTKKENAQRILKILNQFIPLLDANICLAIADRLKDHFSSPNPDVVVTAVKAAGSYGEKIAKGMSGIISVPLVGLLDHPFLKVRDAAAEAMKSVAHNISQVIKVREAASEAMKGAAHNIYDEHQLHVINGLKTHLGQADDPAQFQRVANVILLYTSKAHAAEIAEIAWSRINNREYSPKVIKLVGRVVPHIEDEGIRRTYFDRIMSTCPVTPHSLADNLKAAGRIAKTLDEPAQRQLTDAIVELWNNNFAPQDSDTLNNIIVECLSGKSWAADYVACRYSAIVLNTGEEGYTNLIQPHLAKIAGSGVITGFLATTDVQEELIALGFSSAAAAKLGGFSQTKRGYSGFDATKTLCQLFAKGRETDGKTKIAYLSDYLEFLPSSKDGFDRFIALSRGLLDSPEPVCSQFFASAQARLADYAAENKTSKQPVRVDQRERATLLDIGRQFLLHGLKSAGGIKHAQRLTASDPVGSRVLDAFEQSGLMRFLVSAVGFMFPEGRARLGRLVDQAYDSFQAEREVRYDELGTWFAPAFVDRWKKDLGWSVEAKNTGNIDVFCQRQALQLDQHNKPNSELMSHAEFQELPKQIADLQDKLSADPPDLDIIGPEVVRLHQVFLQNYTQIRKYGGDMFANIRQDLANTHRALQRHTVTKDKPVTPPRNVIFRVSGQAVDFARVGSEPQPTCQRLTDLFADYTNGRGQPISRMLHGQFKVAVMETGSTTTGRIVSRTMLEVTINDENKPVLLIERMYEDAEQGDTFLFKDQIYKYAWDILQIPEDRVFFSADQLEAPGTLPVEDEVYRDTFRNVRGQPRTPHVRLAS